MASSNDMFHFGSSPQSSGSNSSPPPTTSSLDHTSTDDMDTAPPATLMPPLLTPPATHPPESFVDERPALDVEEDSDTEEEQDGGVSLGTPPTLHDLIDAMEWQMPTQQDNPEMPPFIVPPSLSWPLTYTNPFDPNGPLNIQQADGSLQSSLPNPPNISPQMWQELLTQQQLANALTASQQYSHGSESDDAMDDVLGLPSVSDHQAVIDVCKFIDHWAVAGGLKGGLDMIGLAASKVRDWKRPTVITKEDLQGDRYDIQGINWEKLDTTRENARVARLKLSVRRVIPPPPATTATKLPSTENYFSFRRMNTSHRISVAHFQLRNLIASTSRSDIYYASQSKVMHTDASGQVEDCAMNLTNPMGDPLHPSAFQITTLTASEDVLIAGGFFGEYALTSLRSEVGEPPVQGYVTHEYNGITNHAHTFSSRTSGLPQGVFCSNDRCLRILDCTTNTFTHDFHYEQAINCAATAPNGRMRVVVGDFNHSLITDAETGKPFEHLPGHSDHVFACAWADDGIHLATGSQDNTVMVWDARRWDTPLATFASVMSCPRSLRFSPVGGGRRVLFAAEAEDVISVFDAYDFDKRQVLDFYGATAGISVTPDGQSLFVANGDGKFGGLMEFERCAFGERFGVDEGGARKAMGRRRRWQPFSKGAWEWGEDRELGRDRRAVGTSRGRERRGLGLGALVV